MGYSAREKLKQQWPFLQSICNGGWFRPLLFGQPPKLKSVFDQELDGSPKDPDWPVIPSSSRAEIEAKVSRFLEGSGTFPELINTQPIYDQIEQVKKDNKALRFKLRTEHNLPEGVTFREYHKANFLDAAQLLIHRPRGSRQLQALATLDQPEAKFDTWKRDPTKFPHFTAFVGFLIYSLYDAEKNQNSPLDRNWQGDAEQLCFLVDVDAIVSSDLGFILTTRLETPEEILPGLLCVTDVLQFNASPKACKSWNMLALAIAAATGKSWMGFSAPKPRHVVYVNLELERSRFQRRVDEVCAALGVTRRDLVGRIDFFNMKGVAADLSMLMLKLKLYHNPADPWHLCIIDPIYRLLAHHAKAGEGTPVENNNSIIAAFFNELEACAKDLQCAFAVIHHQKKGANLDGDNIESASGAGTFGRAPDVVISINYVRENRQIVKNQFVARADLRYYPGIEPFGLRLDFPLLVRDTTINAGAQAVKKGRPSKYNVVQLLRVLEEAPITWQQCSDAVHLAEGMDGKTARGLCDQARKDTLIAVDGDKRDSLWSLTRGGRQALARHK